VEEKELYNNIAGVKTTKDIKEFQTKEIKR
jgi:hypothetical protein